MFDVFVNWDLQAAMSSCATADDIPPGFSARFLSNLLLSHPLIMGYYIMNVYIVSNIYCSVLCNFKKSLKFL